MSNSLASAALSDTDPWTVSNPFLQAATLLREQAAEQATDSRDFGRGYSHAITVLTDAASSPDGMPLHTRFGIARSLLERTPSDHVCRLIAAVMTGASLADIIAMELEA